jgi:NitT/TauT family transport system substrate-binding protein
MSHRSLAAAAAAATVLLTAACGGDDGDDAAAADGPTTVKVTTFGCEMWNLYAEDAGIFADNDLEVELVQSTGGSANVAAVVSGAADFGYVNGYTAINAYATGFPITMVSGANVNALPPAEPSQGLFVANDSTIASAQDLVGKKIAVNEINGINMIVTTAWLEANGVDPTDVQFVALPFGDQIPAVLSGTVDAAQLGYSLLGDNNENVRSIVDPFAESGEVYIATYVTTNEFAGSGDAAERFQASLETAMDQLNSDDAALDRGFELLAECQDAPVEALQAQPQNVMAATVSVDTLTAMAEQMVDQGLLREVPDVEAFVADSARG